MVLHMPAEGGEAGANIQPRHHDTRDQLAIGQPREVSAVSRGRQATTASVSRIKRAASGSDKQRGAALRKQRRAGQKRQQQQACLSTLEGQRGMLLMFQGCSAYRRSSSAAEQGWEWRKLKFKEAGVMS